MKQFNLEEYLKNPSRMVVTRDGRKVTRILCTDAKSKYPIVALIESKDKNNEYPLSYTINGQYCTDYEAPEDILFDSKKHEGWARICFNNGEYYLDNIIYPSKADAKNHADKLVDTVAAVKIEWEE